MSVRPPRWRTLRPVALVAPLLLLLLSSACSADPFPQSTLAPKADFARLLDDVFMTTVRWAVVVFVLVEGALVYAIFRFRGRPDDPEPKQVHGNTTAEIIWTAIPALILAMIAVPTVRTIWKTYEKPGEDAVVIEVVGHQWWWEFHYPQYGITTANEMHVPVGRTVALKMTTKDVLHSFWVPQFAGKRDVFPNRNTTLWFKAETAGDYPGQCAEFCGIQHARMGFRVVAEAPEQFQGYVDRLLATGAPKAPAPAPADSAKPTAAAGVLVSTLAMTQGPAADTAAPAPAPAVDPLVAEGEKLMAAKGCIGCHSVDATKPIGIGPNLANVGGRSYIAAGMLKNTDENLAHWIREPQKVKEGVLMPTLGVTEAEARALVAYLRTFK